MNTTIRCVLGAVLAVGVFGCKGKPPPSAARPVVTELGHETLDLPPAQQAERQADVLGYLLKTPSDYVREAEIEIDEDNVEDELAKIRRELATSTWH